MDDVVSLLADSWKPAGLVRTHFAKGESAKLLHEPNIFHIRRQLSKNCPGETAITKNLSHAVVKNPIEIQLNDICGSHYRHRIFPFLEELRRLPKVRCCPFNLNDALSPEDSLPLKARFPRQKTDVATGFCSWTQSYPGGSFLSKRPETDSPGLFPRNCIDTRVWDA